MIQRRSARPRSGPSLFSYDLQNAPTARANGPPQASLAENANRPRCIAPCRHRTLLSFPRIIHIARMRSESAWSLFNVKSFKVAGISPRSSYLDTMVINRSSRPRFTSGSKSRVVGPIPLACRSTLKTSALKDGVARPQAAAIRPAERQPLRNNPLLAS